MDGSIKKKVGEICLSIHRLDPNSQYVRIKSPVLSCDQMEVLAMDRADKNVLSTLKSLGNQDGYTATNKPEVMHFFNSLKTYKTK